MADSMLTTRAQSLAVVDDDPCVLYALRFMLELDGYSVRAFRSGGEFLEAAQSERPDCLVLDQNMPAMMGLEVADRLRRSGVLLPVVMITATPSAALSAKAKAAGIGRVIEKPIFGSELTDAIGKCLAKRDCSP
jgi:two-component system, LuxR family, response regulator FixJ